MTTPAAPRLASTVLVLRPSTEGVEVLLVRRARGAAFMADAYVFPGGRVDAADGADALAGRRAAVRELAEEAGLALGDPAALAYFARWVTPSSEPRRYDTEFYLAAAPADAVVTCDDAEVSAPLWLTPSDAVARWQAGALKLPPPTVFNLMDVDLELARARAAGISSDKIVDAILAAARRRTPPVVRPKLVAGDAGITIVLPWDAEYPSLPGEGDALPPDPAAPPVTRFVLGDGRWFGR